MLNDILGFVAGEDGAGWAIKQSSENWYFDNWGEPFLYALIGFLVVFVGIVILIFIVWLVGLLMRKTDNLAFLTNRGSRKKKEEPAAVEQVAPTAEIEGDEISDETKAAIMAALMAYYEEEGSECEFVVKKIKKL